MFALPAKTPTESKVVTFDFAGELGAAVTLSNAAIVKGLVSGTDTGAASLSIGTISIAAQTVLVLISAGTDDNVYSLKCSVDTSGGEHDERVASLRVSINAAG